MKLLQSILIVISILFMLVLLLDQWHEIESLEFKIRYHFLILSFLLLIPVFFLDAFGWYLILRAIGHKPPLLPSVRVWMVSSITRYLPGGIWAYASRATMSRELGIDLKTALISLYIETILLIASSFIIGLPALLSVSNLSGKIWVPVIAIFILGLLLHPRIFSVFKFLPGDLGQKLGSLTLLSHQHTFALYLYYIFFWILFCLVFLFFVLAIYPLSSDNWIIAGSSIAFGFLLGFIIIFVPGGIGIRESAIYFLLLPIIPSLPCLIISIGSRIWVITAEIISTLTTILVNRRTKIHNG